VSIPPFTGKEDVDAYFEWETKVEQIFDLYDYPIEKKAKLAGIEFKGYAITWWNQVRAEFRCVGQDYITWSDMKREMRRRFVPAYYSHALHLRLKQLVQGNRSVDEYYQDMEMCLLCTGIQDDEESLMARLLVGLNKPIAEKVDMTNYTNLTELVHFAKRAEPHLVDSSKTRVTFSAGNNSNQWRCTEQSGFGSCTSSSRPPFTSSSSAVTPEKSVLLKGKDITTNRSSSSNDKSKQKTSNNECFKCGGHGYKKAECPNRRVGIAIADGSYDSHSEDDAHDDSNVEDTDFETFQYEAEDDELELGLNCLVHQSFTPVKEANTEQVIVSNITDLC
jgi:hypothetical protein